MARQTRIFRSGGPAGSLQLYGAGIRVWLGALVSVLAFMVLITILVAPASAQDRPGVETGNGTVRVGDEVFAGDGCARAGDVAAGDCDENSGKDKDGGVAGGKTNTPEEASDRPQSGGGKAETDTEKDASGNTGTTGSLEPEELMGGTTVTESTGPGLAETTGFEGTGSTSAGEPDACPVEPPEDAPIATVARAIDGDTVELQEPVDGYDRVRLIGVDTPEMSGEGDPSEPGAEEATKFTAEMLEGKEVVLETGEEVEDPYSRLLAYVWIPEDAKADAGAGTERPEFFNRTLVDQGYAETMTVEPNDAYAECLAAAENGPKNGTTNTTGGTTEDVGNKDEGTGLLDRIRNLISSEDPSGGQTTTSNDQYGQDGTTNGMTGGLTGGLTGGIAGGIAGGMTNGTTGGAMPAETVPEEGFQEDTLQEDPAPESMTGGETTDGETYGEDAAKNDGAARDRASQGDIPPPEVNGNDGSMKLQEPDTQEPEAQLPEVQDPPARSGELDGGSGLADPALDDPASDELAVSQTPPPASTDTELDTGTDTGSVADQTQLTTLPETSGVPLARLAALPAGVGLICSGLCAAVLLRPKPRRDDSGR